MLRWVNIWGCVASLLMCILCFILSVELDNPFDTSFKELYAIGVMALAGGVGLWKQFVVDRRDKKGVEPPPE